MAGIPQWSKNVQVQANQFKRIRSISLNNSVAIPAGGNYTQLIYAPAGYVSRIVNFDFRWNAPPGATTGNRSLSILAASSSIGVMSGNYNYDKMLYYRYGEWDPGIVALVKFPANDLATLSQLQSTVFDETNPLTVALTNLTDVIDSQSRLITLWVVDEKVG